MDQAKDLEQLAGSYSAIEDARDSELIGKLAVGIVGLLASHWLKIKDISSDEDNDGKVKVAAAIVFDFSGNAPAGAVQISYSPAKTKDETSFRVDDPNQAKLPLDDTTVTLSASGESATMSSKTLSGLPKTMVRMAKRATK